MQEYHVTVAGQRYDLPRPFHVLATQNPLEQEGTYPLPEAQLDRFLMQIDVHYPDLASERRILLETTGETVRFFNEVLIPDGVPAVRARLGVLKPEFFSVTFGAGGSTRERTLTVVKEIVAEGFSAAPHLSCIGSTHDNVREILQQYRAAGITRIVALRGDLPSGMAESGEFRYASELVEFIRSETGDHFHIEVAAYPEWHPQARNPQDDLSAFVRKVKAGADSVSVHYEATRHLDGCLESIRKAGAKAGVVLNPATPVAVLEDILGVADYVLLMSVNPGFGGQKLIPYVLDKVRKLDVMRREKGLALPIEIDGGVHKENLAEVVRAGCDWIVTGSALFHSADPEATLREMCAIAAGAAALPV